MLWAFVTSLCHSCVHSGQICGGGAFLAKRNVCFSTETKNESCCTDHDPSCSCKFDFQVSEPSSCVLENNCSLASWGGGEACSVSGLTCAVLVATPPSRASQDWTSLSCKQRTDIFASYPSPAGLSWTESTGRFRCCRPYYCTPCPVGTFNTPAIDDWAFRDNATANCLPCPSGTYADAAGTSRCTSCPAGTSSPAVGLERRSDCGPCPPGAFAGAGASACASCPAGTIAAAPGASACAACPAGSLAAAPGAAACGACPAGTFAAAAGTTACAQCAAGSFLAGTGATACTPCPPNTSSSSPGGVDPAACQPCAAGAYLHAATAARRCCTPAAACAAGRYQSVPCGDAADAACGECAAACGPGRYEAAPCAGGANRVCAACDGAAARFCAGARAAPRRLLLLAGAALSALLLAPLARP